MRFLGLDELLEEIQSEGGREIPIISSDLGNGFSGAVQDLLKRPNIVHNTKTPFEKNSLGVRSVMSIQQMIARMVARAARDGRVWGKLLASAVSAHNSTTNNNVRDAPEDAIADDQAGRISSLWL